jgi:hypothetical protein
MAGDPSIYRQRALTFANRAAESGSPAAIQKFADLAIVWLMLAVELESRSRFVGVPPKRERDI